MNTSTTVEPKRAALATPATAQELLAVAADPVRWRLLAALAGGPRCVCRLQPAAAVSAPALSHHLRVLREAGLVTAHRRGRWIDYALAPTAAARLSAALPAAPRNHDATAQPEATRGADDCDDPAA
ncbi:helix-turn-helix transcriptional regulator [Actinocrinis puniceicyclus]|uniref:Helix-turn-helix transcriptional regulator n=1 Tax=Actinocrinis puniceicyclus TaxID=977794 RepID=A0A8J8BFQ7_9ACTN|nr:metalloregulator ArsR/SmtB family transcription factor [Actinocrinis puniceicyclus]MBS2966910.1 helix-turn-helix transcriptional regulator [Actinocrinis puniceicyclus]